MAGAPDWSSYFTGLATFAGVVFVVVLAARTIKRGEIASETDRHSRYRLWYSLAVTYELAAAALLSLLADIHGSWVAIIAAFLVANVGGIASGMYVNSLQDPAANATKVETVLGWLVLLPIAAYISSVVYFWSRSAPTELLAAATFWLVLSGTLQALLWYLRTWEQPSKPSPPGADEARRGHALAPTHPR